MAVLAAAACMEYKPPQLHCHLTAATRETHGSTVLRTTGKRCFTFIGDCFARMLHYHPIKKILATLNLKVIVNIKGHWKGYYSDDIERLAVWSR